MEITLFHRPSGLSVSGEVPTGAYTNAQMNAQSEALRRVLYEELRLAVAKKLKTPGR